LHLSEAVKIDQLLTSQRFKKAFCLNVLEALD